jgi:hypothetical protein
MHPVAEPDPIIGFTDYSGIISPVAELAPETATYGKFSAVFAPLYLPRLSTRVTL